MTRVRPRRARPLAAALAAILSLETSPVRAAPSERDLAYERGVQAEEAGEHARAADEYARAYRLTAPAETGPRLLFLRASVAARVRARDGGGDPREHLCHARALLREHLGPDIPGPGADPLADERASLARVEQDLRGIDCDEASPQPVPEDTSPAPAPAAPPPAPKDSSLDPAPAARPHDPKDSSLDPAAEGPVPGATSRPAPPVDERARLRRGLRIAGVTSLGLGLASFVTMGVGIALARKATREGRAACWSTDQACDGKVVLDIVDDGDRADRIVKATASLGGVALLASIIFLGLSLPGRAQPVRVSPRLGPGALGFGLQGRF